MASKIIICLSIASLIFVFSCERKSVSNEVEKERQMSNVSISELPLKIPIPENNLQSESKIELGRLLFFDPILSGNKDVACATCHHPSNGYAESRDISIGVNGEGFGGKRTFKNRNTIPFVKRNAHTVINTAFNGIGTSYKYDALEAPMFWDLRAKSLEEQALLPIKALEEMRGLQYSEAEILEVVLKRLQKIEKYNLLFAEVFPNEKEPINEINLSKAIASFERTLIGNNSRFDLYQRGDKNALSQGEIEGMKLFVKVGCIQCHNGPMFSDYKIHVLGVPDHPNLPEHDLGFENGNGFRTPTLRNLRFTFPFMHNGTKKSVKEILEFYEDISLGKSQNQRITINEIDSLARDLELRVKDFGPIINFLLSLNDDNFDQTIPKQVPSGLAVGGNIGL